MFSNFLMAAISQQISSMTVPMGGEGGGNPYYHELKLQNILAIKQNKKV